MKLHSSTALIMTKLYMLNTKINLTCVFNLKNILLINIPLKLTAFSMWFWRCLWMTVSFLVTNLEQRGHPNSPDGRIMWQRLASLVTVEGCICKRRSQSTLISGKHTENRPLTVEETSVFIYPHVYCISRTEALMKHTMWIFAPPAIDYLYDPVNNNL